MAKKLSNKLKTKLPFTETSLKIIGLFLGGYLRKLHLRKMATLLNKPHRSIALQLDKLEDLRIFNSNLVGRNKEYTLNLDNFLTYQFLLFAETYSSLSYLASNFLIKKILDELKLNISFGSSIILFGSYAKGLQDSKSDIDLLVLGKLKQGQWLKKISAKFNKKISVKVLTFEKFKRALLNNDFLAKEILSEHIILKNQDSVIDIVWDYYEKKIIK